jgi:anti-sigma factor RsiW
MEGALSDTERGGVEEHVAICPDCTIYLAQLRDTTTVLRQLDDEPPVEPARERLFAEFRRLHAKD